YFYKMANTGCNATGWTCISYRGSIGALDAVNFTAGDTVLILVNAESTTASGQTFLIGCGTQVCSSTTGITCGNPVTFSTTGGYGDPDYSNGLGTFCYSNSGQGGAESIYQFIVPSTGTYQFGIISVTNSN